MKNLQASTSTYNSFRFKPIDLLSIRSVRKCIFGSTRSLVDFHLDLARFEHVKQNNGSVSLLCSLTTYHVSVVEQIAANAILRAIVVRVLVMRWNDAWNIALDVAGSIYERVRRRFCKHLMQKLL